MGRLLFLVFCWPQFLWARNLTPPLWKIDFANDPSHHVSYLVGTLPIPFERERIPANLIQLLQTQKHAVFVRSNVTEPFAWEETWPNRLDPQEWETLSSLLPDLEALAQAKPTHVLDLLLESLTALIPHEGRPEQGPSLDLDLEIIAANAGRKVRTLELALRDESQAFERVVKILKNFDGFVGAFLSEHKQTIDQFYEGNSQLGEWVRDTQLFGEVVAMHVESDEKARQIVAELTKLHMQGGFAFVAPAHFFHMPAPKIDLLSQLRARGFRIQAVNINETHQALNCGAILNRN